MTPADWQHVKRLFDSASAMAVEARAAFLERVAPTPAIRHEVEELLAVADPSTDAIVGEVAGSARSGAGTDDGDDDPLVDASLGAYRVVRVVGRGGMGTVFLGERADGQYEGRVAIKVVRRGLDTDDILRRFAAERRILATLDHPNICRLVDAGATADGRPYLVQDFVDGERLLDYCERTRAPIETRLGIFAEVCRAVHHAHQRLVVHRDLKPGNVLIDRDGRPRLLDFGIAKMLRADGDATATHTGVPMFTPDYASPEQLRGDTTTTATDVYSLGVVLFELLTGRRPYSVATTSRREIEHAVLHQVPSPPSVVMPDSPAHAARLRGDLDAVTLKALAKLPPDRYASAEALAADIERHLAGVPVEARPPTRWQRGQRFVRRHRTAVAGLAAVALAVGGGTAAAVREARIATVERRRADDEAARARRRSDDLRGLARSILSEVTSALERVDASSDVRQMAIERALGSLNGLASEAHGDPTLTLDLADAYLRLAAVRGDYFHGNHLGNLAGAVDAYRRGTTLLEPTAEWPASVRYRRARLLSRLYKGLSEAMNVTGDAEGGLATLVKSVTWFDDARHETPDEPVDQAADDQLRRQIILAEADLLLTTGDLTATFDALSHLRAFIEPRFREPDSFTPWGTYYSRLGAAQHILARSVRARLADPVASQALLDASLANQTKAYDFRRKHAEADPGSPDRYQWLASRIFMGNVALDLDHPEGETWLDEAIRISRGHADPYTALWGYHWLGRERLRERNPRGALELFAIYDNAIRRTPALNGAPFVDNARTMLREDLADAQWRAGDRTVAERTYRTALEARERLVAECPTNGEFASNLVYTVTAFASHLAEAGRVEDARAETTRALSLLRRQADTPGAAASRGTEYAWLLLVARPPELRDAAAALPYARRAVALPRGEHPDALAVLALAEHLNGDDDAAVASALRAYDLVPEMKAGRSAAALRRDILANLARHPRYPIARPVWF